MDMTTLKELLESKIEEFKNNVIDDLEEHSINICLENKEENIYNNEILSKLEVYKLRKKGIDGKGVKVAVIDNEFSEIDNELSYKEILYANDKGEIINYTKSNNSGHGTYVSSLIKSKSIGVAPNCEIYAYVINNYGDEVEKTFKEWNIYLKDCLNKGIDVISISLGRVLDLIPYTAMEEVKDMINILRELDNKNIIVVAASGNDGYKRDEIITSCIPALFDEVISVGSVDNDLNISDFSSYGYVDCVSYGRDIEVLSTEGKVKVYGTSFSCPLVTGIITLIKQQNKNISRKEILHLIEKNSIDLLEKGKDFRSGFGLVKAIEVPVEIEGVEYQSTGIDEKVLSILNAKLIQQETETIPKEENKYYTLQSKLNIEQLHDKNVKGNGIKIASTFYGADELEEFNIKSYIDLSGENKKYSCQGETGNILLSILSSKTLGICPESDIYVYKKHSKMGSLILASYKKDIDYFINNKIDIVIYDNFISKSEVDKLVQNGIIVVIPSFNSSNRNSLLRGQASDFENTISVSYIDINNKYITSPNFSVAYSSNNVDCCAYGGDFEYINSKNEIAKCNISSYGAAMFRTLFASYQVAGVLALIKQQNKDLDVYKAKEYIRKNCIGIEKATTKQVGSGLIQAKINI